MKPFLSLVLLFCLAVPVFAVPAGRAVWIWEEDSFRILDNEEFQNEIETFLVERNIRTLYLYADAFRDRNVIVNEAEKYQNYIAKMHRRGFRIYALLGSYYLHTEAYGLPENRDAAVRMFGNVLRYNDLSDTNSRFDGINIDIEPYLLRDWRAKKTLRATEFLELSAEFMRMKNEARSSIAVGPAMPFWYDGIEDFEWAGNTKRLSEHVQDIYDYVAIMDYRNFAAGRDSILSHAAAEIDYADRIGRRVVIGVETGRSEPRKVTFLGKGHVYMDEQLEIVDTSLSRHASFAGFVIHHLGTYRKLLEAGKK